MAKQPNESFSRQVIRCHARHQALRVVTKLYPGELRRHRRNMARSIATKVDMGFVRRTGASSVFRLLWDRMTGRSV